MPEQLQLANFSVRSGYSTLPGQLPEEGHFCCLQSHRFSHYPVNRKLHYHAHLSHFLTHKQDSEILKVHNLGQQLIPNQAWIPAENHGLRTGGSYSDPRLFALNCKPPQCKLEVIIGLNQPNYNCILLAMQAKVILYIGNRQPETIGPILCT